MTIGPRMSTSPSSASLISAPGDTGPDRADLDPVRRVAGAVAAGLGHAPELRQRHADRVEELDHLARRGRGADVHRLHLGRARAARGSSRARARPPWRAPRRARRSSSSPAWSARTLRRPTSSAHSVAFLRSASCSAATPASMAALSFSQMRGTAKNHDGPHLGQVGHDLARVLAAGGGEARAPSAGSGCRRARRCAPSAATRPPGPRPGTRSSRRTRGRPRAGSRA